MPHKPCRPRNQTACLRLTLSIAVLLGARLPSSAQEAPQPNLLQAFQSTLVDVIEKVEPSVVAVLRSPAPTEEQQAQAEARQRLERQFQPGELHAFQQVQAMDRRDDPLLHLRNPTQRNAQPRVTGAGVVIGEGLILTQYLVVKPGELHVVATTSGQQLPAEIVGADPRSSLAVLRVRGGDLKPIELGHAEQLSKGSLVVAVANPYAIVTDGQPTASYGMVSNTASAAPAGENLNNVQRTETDGTQGFRTTLHHLGALIQTDARLGWNASGGALVTLDGKLVGLTTTVATIAGHEQPAGYAIPINAAIRRVIEDLKAGREAEYGLLGIGFDPDAEVTLSNGKRGVVVTRVYSGSAADRAGLKVGDVVARINDQPTANTDQLQLIVGNLPPGVEQDLIFERAGDRREATVRLDKIFVPGEKVITNRPPTWQGIQVDYATAIETSVLDQAKIDPAGCVVVSHIDPDSVSWRQGVRPGMFISHVSGQRVATPEEFRRAVRQAEGNVKLRFTPGNSPANAKPVAPR